MPFTTTCFLYFDNHPVVGSIGNKKFKLVDPPGKWNCLWLHNQNHNLFVFKLSLYLMVLEFEISTTMFKDGSTISSTGSSDPFHFNDHFLLHHSLSVSSNLNSLLLHLWLMVYFWLHEKWRSLSFLTLCSIYICIELTCSFLFGGWWPVRVIAWTGLGS